MDAAGKWLLTAYNIPSTMSVHPLGVDGTIGEEVKQTGKIDGGIYAHQIRMLPSNRALVLVTRGNNATAAAPSSTAAMTNSGVSFESMKKRTMCAAKPNW